VAVKRKNSNSKTAGGKKAAAKSKTVRKPKTAAPGKASNAGTARNVRASLKIVVFDALADMKALDVKFLDVRGLTDIADFMVIASGTPIGTCARWRNAWSKGLKKPASARMASRASKTATGCSSI